MEQATNLLWEKILQSQKKIVNSRGTCRGTGGGGKPPGGEIASDFTSLRIVAEYERLTVKGRILPGQGGG